MQASTKPETSQKHKVSINLSHHISGHTDETKTREVYKALGCEIPIGGLGQCKSCAVGRAKQKNASNYSYHAPSTKANDMTYLDLSKLKAPVKMSYKITKSNWRLMGDKAIQMNFTAFSETNNSMVGPTCIQFNKWNQGGLPVHKIRCDTSREIFLQEKSGKWGRLETGFNL